MRSKIIRFITLTIYVCILNIFFFLIGIVFIDDYMCWSASKLNFGHFFLVVLYSFVQTIVFPVEKKFGIAIVSVLSLLCGLWFVYFDKIGFGNLVGYSYKVFYEKIFYSCIVRKNKCDNKHDNIFS